MIIRLYSSSSSLVATLDLEFGPNVWWVVGQPSSVWTDAGYPTSGNFEPEGTGTRAIRIGETSSAPGTSTGGFLTLSNMPPYESQFAFSGTGTFIDLATSQGTENRVLWARLSPAPLSSIRQKLLAYLDEWIPAEGLSSHNANFKTVMQGIDTEWLKNRWSTDPRFTTCNSFAGGVAQHIGAPAGTGLFRGYLDLSKAGQDVPGSWIPAAPGRYPRPGDYYSRPNRAGTQKFGHVGIVYSLENGIFLSVDGGQDNRPHYGLIARLNNGPIESFNINGWIDLDIYFYHTAVPRRPPLTTSSSRHRPIVNV